MITFRTYPSISNLSSKTFVECVPKEETWHVSEKVHGANFQFCVQADGSEHLLVAPGTRNKFVTTADLVQFHQCGKVVDELTPKIVDPYQKFEECKTMIVYGELFGGSYPGFKCSQKPVQKEILYCPKVSFIAFDINVDGRFLSKTECNKMCKMVNLLCVPILFSGTYEEAINYSKEHYADLSTICELFELTPVLPNIREGHVIQPDNVYFDRMSRVIIKHKNEKWSEVKDKKPRKDKSVQDNENTEAKTEALNMITETRLANLFSHGDVNPESPFGKIANFMVDDIVKEMLCEVDNKPQFRKWLMINIKQELGPLLASCEK